MLNKESFLAKIVVIMTLMFFATVVFLPEIAAANKNPHASAIPEYRPATGKYVFVYTSSKLKWAVYDPSGNMIRTGKGVPGKDYCPDVKRACRTPHGTFHIYLKVGPHFRSSRYPLPNGGAFMPWGMFFHKGYAIHGSNDLPNHPASHGCIRVVPSEAEWLNHTLPLGTTVIVH